MVVVRDLKTGHEAVTSSAGLRIPSSAVGAWAEAGCEGTVGEALADESGCDPTDPHAFLTGGAFPRAFLLEQAVCVAVARLPSRSEVPVSDSIVSDA